MAHSNKNKPEDLGTLVEDRYPREISFDGNDVVLLEEGRGESGIIFYTDYFVIRCKDLNLRDYPGYYLSSITVEKEKLFGKPVDSGQQCASLSDRIKKVITTDCTKPRYTLLPRPIGSCDSVDNFTPLLGLICKALFKHKELSKTITLECLVDITDLDITSLFFITLLETSESHLVSKRPKSHLGIKRVSDSFVIIREYAMELWDLYAGYDGDLINEMRSEGSLYAGRYAIILGDITLIVFVREEQEYWEDIDWPLKLISITEKIDKSSACWAYFEKDSSGSDADGIKCDAVCRFIKTPTNIYREYECHIEIRRREKSMITSLEEVKQQSKKEKRSAASNKNLKSFVSCYKECKKEEELGWVGCVQEKLKDKGISKAESTLHRWRAQAYETGLIKKDW